MIFLDKSYTEEYRKTMFNLFELAGFNTEYNVLTGDVTISPDDQFVDEETYQQQEEIIDYLVSNGIM